MSLEEVLASLRREYAPVLKEAVAELDAALAAASNGGDWRAAWRAAHRIAGTAGSYGFGEASAAARTIEDALDAAPRDDSAITPALVALREAVSAL